MNQIDNNPICDEIIDSCDYIDLSDINRLSQSHQDLSVLQLNIRGLISKQDSLKQFLSEFKLLPDILLLCETWLKRETENKINIPSYKCYHKHKIDRLGGGVSILANHKLRTREHPDLIIPTKLFEYNVVELKTNNNNILLVSGYRPPNSNPKNFMKEYKDVLTKIKELKHHEVIIGMDHNFDLLKSASNTSTNQFLELNIDKDLTPCITKPTRVTNKTATLIDNMLISNKLHYNYTPYVVTDDLSDHFLSLVVLHNINKCKKDKVKICKRKIDSKANDLIKTELDSVNWTYINTMSVNEAFDSFHSTLLETIQTFCPKKEYCISHDKIIRDPWITKGLMNSIKRPKKLYLKQMHSSDLVSTNKSKTYQDVLKKLLRHSKLTYFNAKCLEYKQNSKKLWQLINQVINKKHKKNQIVESLRVDNLLRYSPKDITRGFCDHFANIGKTYAS